MMLNPAARVQILSGNQYIISSVNSRLQVLGGNTYLGGKFDAFFNVFCVLGVFLGGILDSGG